MIVLKPSSSTVAQTELANVKNIGSKGEQAKRLVNRMNEDANKIGAFVKVPIKEVSNFVAFVRKIDVF